MIASDRLYAFRATESVALVACVRGLLWHPVEPRGGVVEGRSFAMPGDRPCHAKGARGYVQVDPFDDSWMRTPGHPGGEFRIADPFLVTYPNRSSLVTSDLLPFMIRPGDGVDFTVVEATGYRAYEPGRVLVACPTCGGWHVITLEDTPEPGYRFSAVAVKGSCPVLRVTVGEMVWRATWATQVRDGRMRSLQATSAYAADLHRARLTNA